MKEILLFLVGILTGFVNVIAGGGSFLTIPLLIFMGLPPTVANGTNRLGIFLQSLFAVRKFHQYGVFPVKFAIFAAIPATLGSLLGAYWATIISENSFKKYLAILMIVITLITMYNPLNKLKTKQDEDFSLRRKIVIFIVFFLIGIYGGFIQAGVGFLILAGMMLTGYDLVAGNAVKTFVILIFTLFALVIFIMNAKVNFTLGLILGAGSIIGANLGTTVSVKKGNKFIQYFVTVCIIIFAIKLLLYK
jgi:hypothetical protein